MSFNEKNRWSIAVAVSLVVGACASAPPPAPAPPPAVPSLTRTFGLVDPAGNRAGTLVLEPVGNGVVYDNGGRVIGTVVPPVPES